MIEKLDLTVKSDILSYQNIFEDKVASIASDVFLIEQLIISNNALTIDDGDTVFVSPESRLIIENGLMTWIRTKNVFDQIRVIDNNGIEISRVDYNNGNPSIVPTEDLQDKSDRYYYTNSIILEDDFLYISKLDLNIENGELEIVDGKYKPMLRVITPLYSSTNQKLGILVVNYLAEDIFYTLDQLKLSESSKIDIVNEEGYYLHTENVDIEFGFMFPDKLDETVDKYNDFDVVSNAKSNISQYHIENELYTVLAISEVSLSENITNTVGKDIQVVSESGDFIAFGKVSYTELIEYNKIVQKYIFFFAILLLVAYLASKLLDETNFAKQERLNALEYSSKHDYLTDLPNRAYIMDKIQDLINKKHKIALMFIDFDGFKKINDDFGHDIGDLALIEGSRRIRCNVRVDDIVARVGGDEFIVLFDELDDIGIISKIAQDIINSFSADFVFDQVSTKMGVSIGISTNEKTTNVDNLIKSADQAMYKVKTGSKNNFSFFKK
jgi:diguanylate cyclase (GGDEF)-like protein